MGGRLRTTLAAVLATGALAGAFSVVAPASPARAATPPGPDGFSVQLGAEKRIFGPSPYVDMPFHTVRGNDGAWRGYIANGDTYVAGIRAGGYLGPRRKTLGRGRAGSFDQCGAWLMGSVYKDPRSPRHWVGWYHAEKANNVHNWCQYSNGATRWTMAFAESWDGGATWGKPKYGRRTNHVISQDSALLGNPYTEDVGNGRVVVKGGYFYMLYQGSSREEATRRLNIARAPLSSFGRPGSWSKWNCTGTNGSCGFYGPGLGGRSKHLADIPATARSAVWNSYLQRWISVAASGRFGFSLWQSDDLIHWDQPRTIYPRVSSQSDGRVDKWHNRTAADKGVYGYSSLLGLDLSSDSTGPDLSLYYMKINPGEGFEKRYLVRRKVSFVATSEPPADRVQLSTYVDGQGRRRTSSEMPSPALGYHLRTNAGYLLTDLRTGYLSLFECGRRGGDRYLRTQSCPSPDFVVRRVGYVAQRRSALASQALWRCYDAARDRHFAAVSADASTRPTSCTATGVRAEFVLGWALRPIR